MKILHAGCTATGEPMNGFQKALIKVCTDYREINSASAHKTEELLRVNTELKPDIVFFQYQTDGVVFPHIMARMKQENPDGWFVNYTGDVRFPLPEHYIQTGKEIDCTLFCNYTDVHEARRLGVNAEYLQYGYDPEIYFPTELASATPEIVFMGNNYVNQFPLSIKRAQMVDYLRKEYGSRFGVYGTNWTSPNGNFMGNQHGEAETYRGCKIAINFSHFDYERYSSDRMFRIMGSGALCMTHRYAGLHLDFETGKELIAWDTFEHMKAQIDYYLEHEDERKQIASAGQQKVSKTHTFDAMIANLIKLYNEHRVRKVSG